MREITTSSLNWDSRFMVLATVVATWSKDPDRKVGAVLVSEDRRQVSVGFNGFPRGIADTGERLSDRRMKLSLTVHAERNALDNAGFSADGCTLYTTRFPCSQCAKGVIQKGVTRLVTPAPDLMHKRWGQDWALSLSLLGEAGVNVHFTCEVEGVSHAVRE